jgi:superfamily I DNA and/or RNA helicase
MKDLVLKNVDPKIIEERKIEVGDVYSFQGDERDVIFLSMVKALDSSNPSDTIRALTDEKTKQRYNVAASRARDQMFLFHPIPLRQNFDPTSSSPILPDQRST